MNNHTPYISVSPNEVEEVKTSYGPLTLKEIDAQLLPGQSNAVAGYVLPQLAKQIETACNAYNGLVKALKVAADIQHETSESRGEITCTEETRCIFCQALAKAGVKP